MSNKSGIIAMKLTCPNCTHEFTPPIPLSPRAKEALPYVVAGLSNREIATKMDVEVRTVKAYVHNAFRHFKVKNRVALAVIAYKTECKKNQISRTEN